MRHIYNTAMKLFLQAGLITVAFLYNSSILFAQNTISGKVITYGGKPIPGANVYLLNTIDGATTDSNGTFSFTTEEKGAQTIVAEEVSYQNAGMPITINGDVKGIELKMKTGTVQLQNITVTAGSFEASGSEGTILKPLDIVTTAGTQADVVRAIQTLPGTQQQGVQTGLFVRGGDASEAAVIIDGMVAQNAFLSTAPGVAARSRFGPFQFKGVSFSSGGYSARYGQALSSVLELNSNDQPDKSTINMGVHMAGIYASASKLMKKSSIEGSANYTNLTPFYGIAKTNFDFYDVPKGGGGSAKYTYKPNENGIFKVLVNYQQFQNGTRLPNPEDNTVLDFGLKNSNVYGVVSYRQTWKAKWGLYSAGMYSYNQDDIKFNTTPIVNKDDRSQIRLEGKYFGGTKVSVLLGTEVQHFTYDRTFATYNTAFEETQIAGYLETEWSPLYWLAIKPGVRYEHSALIDNNTVSPRLAAAIRAGMHGQFSVASGVFYQLAEPQYYISNHRPGFQQSVHYIANYQYMHNDRTLRLEAYYKDYNQLVREQGAPFNPNNFRFIPDTILVDNTGYGYAQGLELFWRDKKTVKNGDYWISYSYIDTRRLYKNYLASVQPDFIATHNLNIVTKYFIPKWATQVNATYNYSSGRPYYNPTSAGFMSDRTPAFHNLSITINYLRSFGKWFSVIYAGVDNITNYKNVFGYRYTGDYNTGFTRNPVIPPIYRSVFVGVNFSLSAFDIDEL